MDREAHSDGDGHIYEYETVRRQRTTNLSQLTKLYNELEKKMISRDNKETVKFFYVKLCDRFEEFKTSHMNCLDLCPDVHVVETLEMNFDSCQKNLKEFRERFSEWINGSMENIADDEVGSRISSSSSSSSKAKLRTARANRLKVEHKLKKTEEKLKLEREKRELEIKEQLLEKRSELEEAKLEEQMWQEAYDKDNDIINTNQNKGIDADRAVSSRRNKILINDDIDIQEVSETKATKTDSDEKCEFTAGSSKSNISSIDSAFQRLASTLQEGFNLPKPELLTFDGKPINYTKFIKNFETNVENRVGDDQMRLSYLIQYCKGEAKSSIEDCVLLERTDGYKRARSILYSRYGRSHIIARSYIEKLVYGTQINAQDLDSLSQLSLDMQKCEITLSQLGFISDIDNSDNLRKIVKRLPMHLRVKWVDIAHSITESGREPRFTDLTKFIDQKSRIAAFMYGLDLTKEKADIKGSSGMRNKPHDYVRENVSTYATNNLHTSENVKHEQKCICCNGTCRYIEFCSKFKSMNLADRLKFVSRNRLCYNCLKGKHFANSCRKPKSCTVSDCNVKHNLLLHSWVKPESDNTASPSVNCAATDNSLIRNCLGIIPVLVRGGDGNSCQTYALLDDGADKTLCDERLLKKLNLATRPVTFHMSTVSSSGSTIHGQEVDLQVRPIDGDEDVSLQKVWSVKKLPISTRSAAENADIRKLAYLADIDIPKIDTNDVMLLIGTDSPEAQIPLEVRSGTGKQPFAIRSRLGWAIRGPIINTSSSNVINVHFEESRDVLLQRQLERMRTTDFNDNKSDDKNLMSVEDKQALDIMESSITYEDGHYKLGLPWRDKNTSLTNNIAMAQARLQQLKRRLERDDTLHKMYTTTVNEYIEKGYAKEVSNIDSESKRMWYLPHHPVTNVNKPGKVRVVFDCAAKYQGISLNSKLLQGPDLMNSLVGVLIRFRQGQIALAADIEAMFPQVRVQEEDCDVLRFLWWPNGDLNQKPRSYCMQVHLFGATSSPSCAGYALKRTARDNSHLFDLEVSTTVEKIFMLTIV
ncbi:unnamed protein product [Mytilus edulis]|uniref:Peptidase aspartic putative domain-containing protein n=1 Tax=Mytilus edulis TaxID=6550 RepID=A0A8S3R2Q0_MYTED|nr:unnamed protein product [Mytilus edulis]